jgi:hypothetical protein
VHSPQTESLAPVSTAVVFVPDGCPLCMQIFSSIASHCFSTDIIRGAARQGTCALERERLRLRQTVGTDIERCRVRGTQHCTAVPPLRAEPTTVLHRSLDHLSAGTALANHLSVTHRFHVPSTSRPWSIGMVEVRRSVTAGHGPVTTGQPVRSHCWSRLVTAGHVVAGCVTVVTAPSRRFRAPTARHAGVARSRNARLRDRRAIALRGTSRHAA